MSAKTLFLFTLIGFSSAIFAQKHVYNVELFGKKIGMTTVERTDKGNGEVVYKLTSNSEVNAFFTQKSSQMDFEVIYKNGKLFSSYCKNVKDGVTEITTILWDGAKYVIKKGSETRLVKEAIDFSSIFLYFLEPQGKSNIFSERLGMFCNFLNTSKGEYECKLATGVNNIYRYKNGVLYELEMSKGASVFMRLIQ